MRLANAERASRRTCCRGSRRSCIRPVLQLAWSCLSLVVPDDINPQPLRRRHPYRMVSSASAGRGITRPLGDQLACDRRAPGTDLIGWTRSGRESPVDLGVAMESSKASTTTRRLHVIGVVVIVMGALFSVVGLATWFVVRDQLSGREHHRRRRRRPTSPVSRWKGPFTAYAQANIIERHALEASEGLTYAELPQDDPRRDTAVMTASVPSCVPVHVHRRLRSCRVRLRPGPRPRAHRARPPADRARVRGRSPTGAGRALRAIGRGRSRGALARATGKHADATDGRSMSTMPDAPPPSGSPAAAYGTVLVLTALPLVHPRTSWTARAGSSSSGSVARPGWPTCSRRWSGTTCATAGRARAVGDRARDGGWSAHPRGRRPPR